MAYPESDWLIAQAFYEQGLSLGEIVARDAVKLTGIQDRATISRKAARDGWVKGKNATVLKNEVAAHSTLDDALRAKLTFNATDVG